MIANVIDGRLANGNGGSGYFGLMFLPPCGQAVKQTKRVLRGLVERHLMLVLASLLGKGTNPFMNPFVTVDLGTTRVMRSRSNNSVDTRLK